MPTGDVSLAEDLTYEERPIKIVERQMRQLCSRLIPQVCVQWDDINGW